MEGGEYVYEYEKLNNVRPLNHDSKVNPTILPSWNKRF